MSGNGPIAESVPGVTPSPTVVTLSGVSKRFVIRKDKSIKDRLLHPRLSRSHVDDFMALNGINLEIPAGSTIGLIGPNGSGKSTLLKVIGGIIEADTGVVRTRGRLAALLELGAGFHPDLTGRENIYLNAAILGMSRVETEERFDAIVAFSGIEQFIDTQVKFYSSGMYVRLAFAVAIHADPDIVLVDEVLAVGDEAFQQKCLDKIQEFQSQGRTIIIVSHSMGQITSLCDRAIVLRHGNVVFDGQPEGAVKVLRAGFTESGEDQSSISVQTGTRDRERMGDVQITRVESTVPDGVALRPGDDLVVSVELEVSEPTSHWDLTVALVSPLGATLLATSAHASGLKNVPIGGKRSLRFVIPNLSLGRGGYSTTVTYFDDRQREVCRAEGVGGFKVDAGDESIGAVYSRVLATINE